MKEFKKTEYRNYTKKLKSTSLSSTCDSQCFKYEVGSNGK